MLNDTKIILKQNISIHAVHNSDNEYMINFKTHNQLVKGDNFVKYIVPILNELQTLNKPNELFSFIDKETHVEALNKLQFNEVLKKLIDLKVIEKVEEKDQMSILEKNHVGEKFYVKGFFSGVVKKKVLILYDCEVTLANYIKNEIIRHEMIECIFLPYDTVNLECVGSCNLVLSIHEEFNKIKIGKLNDISLEKNILWTSLIIDQTGFRIGPTVKGIDLPCYECLEPRLNYRIDQELKIFYRKSLNYNRSTLNIVTGLLCEEINRILFNDLVLCSPVTHSAYIEYFADNFELSINKILKQPNCNCSRINLV